MDKQSAIDRLKVILRKDINEVMADQQLNKKTQKIVLNYLRKWFSEVEKDEKK